MKLPPDVEAAILAHPGTTITRKPVLLPQDAPGSTLSPLDPDGRPLTEKAFQAAVVKLAESLGWLRDLTYHTHRSECSTKGFPDLVLVKPPRVLFLELKTDKGRVRPEQETWLAALAACPGIEAYLFRPRHWSEIVQLLSRVSG